MSPLVRRALGCVLSVLLVLAGVGVAFPATPNDVDIELFYNSTWNNIDTYAYHREAAPIVITRGRANEGKRCDPGKLTLQINNRDGRFSPRNPTSPLYGLIGRNTQIRVKVTYNSVTYTRFVGEVVAWPSRWDVSGKDVWVPIEAFGLLKRLGQGSKPLRSPIFRAVLAEDPVAYWPVEGGDSTTTLVGSGLSSGSPLVKTGTVDFAVNGDVVGSDVLPDLLGTTGILTGPVSMTSTGSWTVQAVIAGKVATSSLEWTIVEWTAGGATWVLDRTDTNLRLSRNGSLVDFVIYVDPAGLNGPRVVQATASTSGTDLLYRITVDNVEKVSGTLTSTTVGAVSGVKLVARSAGSAGAADVGVVGHVAVFGDVHSAAAVVSALGGFDGEQAHTRFGRICTQDGLLYTTTGSLSARMSPERKVTRLQALRDCEDADQGFLFERRDALGLHLRTNASRYNQPPIALDYNAKDIGPPFDPEPDDQHVANDREVKRRGGSLARRELTSGPLSTQDPPTGVGRYDDSITVDAYSDDQLEHIANWRLALGTIDAERYPRVRVDLAARPALIPTLMPADSGSRITIANLPDWLPPDDADLIVEGYREVIGFYTWDFVFNCSPGGVYSSVGRWDTVASELKTAVNSTATSFDVAVTSGPLWTTDDAQDGWDWEIGGERVTVTDIAASTITYGAVGAVAHADNANVTPGLPASLAQGNLMLCLAAIRNSGTGTPSTPAGWTRLAVFGSTVNVQLFAKIAGASETDPTISFTGGAVGASTSAQIIRLTGKWHSTSNILIGSAACLNASAQDITIPGLSKPDADNAIVVRLGWKQDDWTSVTSPGTEIDEPSTTLGDDQGIVWSRTIQTTAASVASTTFTVTGGVSAISRGAILALRCDYQTATVTRSVNGVVKSQVAGEAINMWTPLRWGL